LGGRAGRTGRKRRVGLEPSWRLTLIEPTNPLQPSAVSQAGVTLIDGAACDARAPACSTPVASLAVGNNPISLAVDPPTRTLYVANQGLGHEPGSLSVVDIRTCNATDTSRCSTPHPTTPTGRGTVGVTVDPTTHAVYATGLFDATVAIIRGATCNAMRLTGCAERPPRVAVDDLPADVIADRAHHTLYVLDTLRPAISIINTRAPCRPARRCVR
jgi:hypothetical protein